MSNEKCFCHLSDKAGNEYAVKDATARKIIEEEIFPVLGDLERGIMGNENKIEQHAEKISALEEKSDEYSAHLASHDIDIITHHERISALESAGSGSSGGGKLYLHTMRIVWNEYETTEMYEFNINFYSTSSEPIDTLAKAQANANRIKNANVIWAYCDDNENYRGAYLDFTSDPVKAHYFEHDGWKSVNPLSYRNSFNPNILTDTVTEV